MDKFFVTILGIGYSKFAPGTLGSICALVFFYFFFNIFSLYPILLYFIIILVFIFGWYFTFTFVQKNKIHDPSEIIIDEFLGQLIALVPLLFLGNFNFNKDEFIKLLISSFILFRFFDIIKPWPINVIDKSKTSLSIMMDDIIAGFFSSIILLIFYHVYQK